MRHFRWRYIKEEKVEAEIGILKSRTAVLSCGSKQVVIETCKHNELRGAELGRGVMSSISVWDTWQALSADRLMSSLSDEDF